MAAALPSHPALREAILWRNKIGDEGAVALAEALVGNQGLKLLDLRYNYIGDVGVRALAKALESNEVLTELDMRSNQVLEEAGAVLAAALGCGEGDERDCRGTLLFRRRVTQTADVAAELRLFLAGLGLEAYAETIAAEEIEDVHLLSLVSEEDLRQLVPKAGPRGKLRAALRSWQAERDVEQKSREL